MLRKSSKMFLTVTIVGIFVALYHAYDEISAYNAPGTGACDISQKVSCTGVFESHLTSIFGVPFYVLGLIWFPLILVVGGLLSGWGRKKIVNATPLLLLLMIGNIFTIYLWYLELVTIGVICPVCVGLYLINYILTALVVTPI